MPVVPDLPPMYAGADAGAIATILAKLAVEKSLHGKLEDARSQLGQRVVAGLKEFRAMHAQHFRAHHRIIWPASLRMLPLYALGAPRDSTSHCHNNTWNDEGLPTRRAFVCGASARTTASSGRPRCACCRCTCWLRS